MAKSELQEVSKPTLTVDVLIPNDKGELLVIRRGHAPYKGMWCWPGGMVDAGETVRNTGIREVKEETRLDVKIDKVLGIYSELGRDPRGHFISIVLLAHPVKGDPEKTAEALDWKWAAQDETFEMAFDHARIRADYQAFAAGAHDVILD